MGRGDYIALHVFDSLELIGVSSYTNEDSSSLPRRIGREGVSGRALRVA
jgi:hypothetical protein